jgi:hypothetical protein
MAVAKKPAAPKSTKPRVSPLAAATATAGALDEKDPQFDVGEHVATFNGLEEKPPVPGQQTWVLGKFTDAEGTNRVVLFCTGATSLEMTGKRMKSLAMALIGCPTVADYNAFDPHGEFIDALLGFENKFTEVPEGEGNVNDYLGKQVVVVAVLGSEVKDKPGEYYTNVSYREYAEEAAAE